MPFLGGRGGGGETQHFSAKNGAKAEHFSSEQEA